MYTGVMPIKLPTAVANSFLRGPVTYQRRYFLRGFWHGRRNICFCRGFRLCGGFCGGFGRCLLSPCHFCSRLWEYLRQYTRRITDFKSDFAVLRYVEMKVQHSFWEQMTISPSRSMTRSWFCALRHFCAGPRS